MRTPHTRCAERLRRPDSACAGAVAEAIQVLLHYTRRSPSPLPPLSAFRSGQRAIHRIDGVVACVSGTALATR